MLKPVWFEILTPMFLEWLMHTIHLAYDFPYDFLDNIAQ